MNTFTSISKIVVNCAISLLTMAAVAKSYSYDTPQTEAFLKRIDASLKLGKLQLIEAKKLGAAYASNEVSADQKYKDKYLIVSGTVDSVAKSMLGAITVRLVSSNQFLPAYAYLDDSVLIVEGMEDDRLKVVKTTLQSAEAAAAMLKKGQKVSMFCKGGGVLMGSPQLSVCDTISK